MSSKRFIDVYNKLKATTLEQWAKTPAEEIGKVFGSTTDAKNVGTMFLLAARVAHSVPEAEFVDFMENDEAPPMKLKAEEMQALRGGRSLVVENVSADKLDDIMAAASGAGRKRKGYNVVDNGDGTFDMRIKVGVKNMGNIEGAIDKAGFDAHKGKRNK